MWGFRPQHPIGFDTFGIRCLRMPISYIYILTVCVSERNGKSAFQYIAIQSTYSSVDGFTCDFDIHRTSSPLISRQLPRTVFAAVPFLSTRSAFHRKYEVFAPFCHIPSPVCAGIRYIVLWKVLCIVRSGNRRQGKWKTRRGLHHRIAQISNQGKTIGSYTGTIGRSSPISHVSLPPSIRSSS